MVATSAKPSADDSLVTSCEIRNLFAQHDAPISDSHAQAIADFIQRVGSIVQARRALANLRLLLN